MVMAVVVAAMAVPWSRLPAWTETVPPVTFLAAVALLRHGGGGADSALAALVVLPVLFIALHGGRRSLLVVVAVSAVVFFVPVSVLGAPDYPASEWRRGGLFLVVNAVMGATVQAVVQDSRARARDLATIATYGRDFEQLADPREAIITAMRAVGEADFAVLLESAGDGLVSTAAAGIPLPTDILISHDDPRSGTVRAYTTGTTLLAPEAAAHLVSPSFVAQTGVRSAIFEPACKGDRVVGVLLGYRHRLRTVPERTRDAVAALAPGVAAAIERSGELAALRAQAETDPLTGAANRRAFSTFLERALAHAARTGTTVSVALVDLDHFKHYNDEHGHQAGDALLIGAVTAWSEQLRGGDLLARYGGEEFAAVLPDASPPEVTVIAERLRRAVPPPATCSIGIATSEGAEEPGTLIARADAALYQAKADGRNRIRPSA